MLFHHTHNYFSQDVLPLQAPAGAKRIVKLSCGVVLDPREGGGAVECLIPRGGGGGGAIAENPIPGKGGRIEGSDPRGGGGTRGDRLEFEYLCKLEFIFQTALGYKSWDPRTCTKKSRDTVPVVSTLGTGFVIEQVPPSLQYVLL